MTNGRKIITTTYILLSVLAVLFVGVTTVSIFDVLPAMLLLWLLFFGFYLGSNSASIPRSSSTEKTVINSRLDAVLEKHKILLFFTAVVCSLLITRFYTGQTLFSVIQKLLSGENLYSEYQQHHAVNNIGVFSFAKVPYILMNAALNFITFYSILYFLKFKERPKGKDYCYVLLVSLTFWFFGLARGTNFEIFELCVAIIYSVLTRNRKKRKLPFQAKAGIAALIVLACIVFSWMYAERGSSGRYITSEILFDEGKFLPTYFPATSLLIARLSQYFSFGFYYTSAAISKVIFSSVLTLVGALIPAGLQLTGITDLVIETNKVIDAGTNWRPDIVPLIGDIGFVGAFVAFTVIGYVIRRLETSSKAYMPYQLLTFYLLLQMFSFPIGNFILISSSNQIVLLATIVLSLLKAKNIKIKLA